MVSGKSVSVHFINFTLFYGYLSNLVHANYGFSNKDIFIGVTQFICNILCGCLYGGGGGVTNHYTLFSLTLKLVFWVVCQVGDWIASYCPKNVKCIWMLNTKNQYNYFTEMNFSKLWRFLGVILNLNIESCCQYIWEGGGGVDRILGINHHFRMVFFTDQISMIRRHWKKYEI